MTDVLILDAVRTPVGRADGVLAALQVEELISSLINALLERNSLQAQSINEVIIGNAAGPGGNPARVGLLHAGLPMQVPGLTVDRQCGSGLEAINLGARLIQSGAAQCVLAGGVESVSTSPKRPRSRFSPEHIGDPDMGIAAENVAKRYQISRQRQDQLAFRSHQNAVASSRAGDFADEIIPQQTLEHRVLEDECPRDDCSLERLARLPPVFLEGGSVTAGNTCPINDGAALVLLMSAELAQESAMTAVSANRRRQPLYFIDAETTGVDPNYLGIGPVPAVQALLARQQLHVDDLGRIEFNEAFAAQVLASTDALGLPLDKVNVGGGALALGHPYGASGAILVTRLFHGLADGATGLATLGAAGGLGTATLFRR